jgi:hypothetical protein
MPIRAPPVKLLPEPGRPGNVAQSWAAALPSDVLTPVAKSASTTADCASERVACLPRSAEFAAFRRVGCHDLINGHHLLAAPGGGPSDAATFWRHGAVERRTAFADRVGAAAGKQTGRRKEGDGIARDTKG